MTPAQARDTNGGRVRILRIFAQTVESAGGEGIELYLIKEAGIRTRKSEAARGGIRLDQPRSASMAGRLDCQRDPIAPYATIAIPVVGRSPPSGRMRRLGN